MTERTTRDGRALSAPFSRRQFVKLAALAGVPLPSFLLRAARSVQSGGREGPVLVVVQLSGGNDGLNTVIPCEDPRYHASRPSLAVDERSVLRLESGGALGFHPSLAALYELYREGKVTVIENAGYPDSSRSHFRSMEIWHTASAGDGESAEGWLGRIVSRHRFGALDVGDESPPLALAAEGVQVPALQNLDWLETLFSARGAELRRMLLELTERRRTGDLEYLRGASRATFTQLDRLEAIRGRPSPVKYPDSALGQRLAWTAQLICGGYPSRIYYTSFGGFDTHARQKDVHARLLRQFSEALAAFMGHLAKAGADRRVALVAFSEFGRRVRENGSQGTDHGAAGPMFVVSGACRGGVLGGVPDLENLVRGDVRHQVDFRSVYATLIESVLEVDPDVVLGRRLERLPILERMKGAG